MDPVLLSGSTDGVRSSARLRRVRESVQRQPSSSRLLLPRSISLPDVRPTDLSRKPARHRDVSAGRWSPSSIMAASAARSRGAHWPMPTALTTGRIFADFAQVLIGQLRKLYAEEPFGVELEQTAYALDSTTIDLCSACSLGRNFAVAKGLHTLVDLQVAISRLSCGLPTENARCDGPRSSADRAWRVLRWDRGYVDFRRLYRFTTCSPSS